MRISSIISGISLVAVAVAVPDPAKGTRPTCGRISQGYAAKVVSQFKTDGITPDLIEATTLGTPKVKVNVKYGSKAVRLGTYFTTAQTLNAPALTFTGEADYDPATTKYIYFLVDPDVPQDGSLVQVNYNHWTVGNAQPSCITSQTPVTIVSYEALTPLSTTQHRYTFLVYRQPKDFDPTDPAIQVKLQVRTPFDLNNFAQDNKLKLVGGNFLKESITNGLNG